MCGDLCLRFWASKADPGAIATVRLPHREGAPRAGSEPGVAPRVTSHPSFFSWGGSVC